jgi:upstream activation factor subunit UAF30
MAKKKKVAKKAAKRPAKKAAKRPAKKAAAKRKPNAAFLRPVQPDSLLAPIVGSAPLPRTELTKKLWGYIKRKGLQDPKERRYINADDVLRPVLGGKARVSMFELTKLVSKHVR